MGHVTESSRRGFFVLLLTGILFCCLPSATGQKKKLQLHDHVFVALKGENLNISYRLRKPPNQTEDALACFDPLHKSIYYFVISEPAEKDIDGIIVLENITLSGQYYCQYRSATDSWFLRVRDSGYEEVWRYSEAQVVIVTVVTGLLLLFSVGGSIYVFRGNWACCKTKSKVQKTEERQGETKDTANDEGAQSGSFYASLEARPRSVYDVLDHSAVASAGGQREPTKAKTPKKKETPKTTRETTKKQEDGIFESVYENF